MKRMWKEDEGVLSFEWILLVTLLTIGIVSGVAAARDAIIDEFGDVAQAMLALDQSYIINHPLRIEIHDPLQASAMAADSAFIDNLFYDDCGRGADGDFPGGESNFSPGAGDAVVDDSA